YTEQNQVPLSFLTRDPDEVEQYKVDSLMHTKITARFFMEATASGEWAIRNAGSLTVPTFLYHGTSDYITSLSASKEFVRNAPNKLITFEELDGTYHDIYHDFDRDRVWEKMSSWLNEKC
ncbi:MAG: alpha/beta hydrolase, partial [Bacteroidota bacterium]